MSVTVEQLRRIVDEVYPTIVALRRDLHRHPEIGYEEVRTSRKVAEHLRRLGIPYRAKVGRTGVVGLIQGTRPGKCIAMRGDMDALPMTEETRVPWKSVVPNRHHACGHDGNTANLAGVASVLSRLKGDIKGSVKLLFQPAEEGGAGALAMIKDGAFRNPRPDVVYGIHTAPALPLGKVGWRSGPCGASQTAVDVVFRGAGSHGAAPHKCADPVVQAAQFIRTVQTIASRRTDPFDQIVVSFGIFKAGSARNVIPTEAKLVGTIRAYKDSTRAMAVREIRRMARGIARASAGVSEVTIKLGYPTVVNDKRAAEFLGKVAVEMLGRSNVVTAPAVMGAEDFSYYLREAPGVFFRLGNGTPNVSTHSPLYDFDDRALKSSVLVMSALAIRWLEKH